MTPRNDNYWHLQEITQQSHSNQTSAASCSSDLTIHGMNVVYNVMVLV